jgi:hypothetical protein
MPEPKNAKDEGEHPEPEHRAPRPRRRGESSRESVRNRDRDRDDDHEREREHSNRRGRDFPVFLKIRGARWRGSEPPTAEAYARALAQWRQLPGAIGVAATDLGGTAGAAKPPGDGAGGNDAS